MHVRALRRGAAIAVALAVGVVGLSTPSSEAVGGGAAVGGVVATDTVWDAGSYSASAPVQIPVGVTLTLRAGVELSTSAATAFSVAGTLRVEGSAASPVRVGSSDYYGSLLVGVADPGAEVFIDHLQADFFPGIVGDDELAAFSMANSRVWSRADRNAHVLSAPLPAGSVLRGNEFTNVEDLRLTLDGPTTTVVEDNRIAGGTLGLHGAGPVSFTGNAFAPGPDLALRASSRALTPYDPDIRLDAEGNYWGADTAGAIDERIEDGKELLLFNPLVVDFDPFLTAAPQVTTFTPLPPLDAKAVGGARAATVSWAAPASDGGAPVSGYIVTAQPSGQQVAVPGSARQATVTGLTDGVPSTFTVTASNIRGTSLPAPSNVVTPLSPPAAPTWVEATTGSHRQALVSWTASAGATSYRVIASPGGQSESLLAQSTRSRMFTFISGLTAGKTYRFTVFALNSAGSSAPSATSAPVRVVANPGVVAKPRAVVKASRAGHVEVRLSWRAPASNGARISYYRVVGSRGLGMTKVRAPKRSLVFENLKPGRYTFRVSAWSSAGHSRAKYPVTVRIPAKR
jgi:hypothetical protein